MSLKYKILPLTVLLAVGIALTACGSSGAPASTPASSAVPASSRVQEEGVVEPVGRFTIEDVTKTPDTITFVSADIASEVKDGTVTARIYSYDAYEKADIDALKAGDKIRLHVEYMTGNQYAEVEVTSIEKNDPYHTVTINGGIEQEGGLDLILMDGSEYYRTITFDDYPVYYEVGETELSLADDVVLKDSSADPQAEAVETTGASAVAAAINADPDNWTVYNTTLVVQGGRVLEVRRIWVP
jgi:uncharacterized protein (UPF0333 family)